MATKKKLTTEELIKQHSGITGSQYEAFESSLPVLSTGNIRVDMATGQIDPETGCGGLRARDSMEVCGEPGNGKNVILHSMIRTTQERWPGRNIVCVFTEKPDIRRMIREGVKVDDLIILGCYHKDIEAKKTDACYIMEALLDFCEDPNIRLITIDSLAMLTTDAMDDKALEDAAQVSAIANKFNPFIGRYVSKTAFAPLVYTNHYREPVKIGFSFVAPNPSIVNTYAGRTKEFLAFIRMKALSTPLWRRKGKEYVLHSETGKRIQDGLKTTYTIFRNRYSNRDNFRVCSMDYVFETCRYNNEEAAIEMAQHFVVAGEKGELISTLSPGVVQKGARYTIGDEKFHGMTNAVQYLKDNQEVYKALYLQLVERSAEYFADREIVLDLDSQPGEENESLQQNEE